MDDSGYLSCMSVTWTPSSSSTLTSSSSSLSTSNASIISATSASGKQSTASANAADSLLLESSVIDDSSQLSTNCLSGRKRKSLLCNRSSLAVVDESTSSWANVSKDSIEASSATDNADDRDDCGSPSKRALTESLTLLCKIRSGPNSPLIGGSAQRPLNFNAIATSELDSATLGDQNKMDFSGTTVNRFTFTYEGPQKVPKLRPRGFAFGQQKFRFASGNNSSITAIKSSSTTQKTTITSGPIGIVKRRHVNAQRRIRVDFVKLFAQQTYNMDVVTEIFSYLRDDDLRAVARVSWLWRRTLFEQKSNYARYLVAEQRFMRDKENVLDSFGPTAVVRCPRTDTDADRSNKTLPTAAPRSPPRSPHSEKHRKFTKIAEMLTETQSLTKCSTCEMPAVCENQIAECTKCSKIWCMRCMRNDVSSLSLSPSRSPTVKAIAFSRSPLFNYQPGGATDEAAATDHNDDHLLCKYFLTTQNVRPRNANSRFAKHGTLAAAAAETAPSLSLKRVLPFSKLTATGDRRRRRSRPDDEHDPKTPPSANKYNGKFHALCDFSNLVDQMAEVSATTAPAAAADRAPAQSASAALLVPNNWQKRQNFARDHICAYQEQYYARNDEINGSHNELSIAPASNAAFAATPAFHSKHKRSFCSRDVNERLQHASSSSLSSSSLSSLQQQCSSQLYQSDSSDDLTPPSPKDSRTTKQRLRRLCR